MITINIETPNHTRYAGLFHKIDTVENSIFLHSVICYGKLKRPIHQKITDSNKHNFLVQFPLEYVQPQTIVTTTENKIYKAQMDRIDIHSKLPVFQNISLLSSQTRKEKNQVDFNTNRSLTVPNSSKRINIKKSTQLLNKSVEIKQPSCFTNNYRQLIKLREYNELIGQKPKLKIRY